MTGTSIGDWQHYVLILSTNNLSKIKKELIKVPITIYKRYNSGMQKNNLQSEK